MVMPIREDIRPLRRAEYDRLVQLGAFEDERIELLDGVLVEMSPIGPAHSSAVQKLTALLVPALMRRATVRIQSQSPSRMWPSCRWETTTPNTRLLRI